LAEAGHVRAERVIVAADGALPALVPGVAVRARRLHMVATEPLSERLVDCPVYARFGFEYFQQTPDNRLLAGGFSDLDADLSYTDRDEGNPAVWERIELYLAEALHVRAPITHRWVGTVGYSDDALPVIGRHDGVYVAGGYSGHGNVLGYLAGRQLADLIAG
jgi:glycine/D-amino acid oxidase-like deaminating enzyme